MERLEEPKICATLMTEEMHATCVLERVSWIQKLIFSSFYYAFTEQCTRGHSGGFFDSRVAKTPLVTKSSGILECYSDSLY